MTDILSQIAAYKRDEVARAKTSRPLADVETDARDAGPVRGFVTAIREAHAAGRTALIAEIKKASPSKGLIRADFDPAVIARDYTDGGATCLSVLTDTPSFQGHADYLAEARTSCPLPVLRKDFMLDTYQVPEARSWGADCILIIMAMIEDGLAAELAAAAADWQMDVLTEVHDAAELERALRLETQLIGINNRNLKTFETGLEITEELAADIPRSRIVVSESGIATPGDIARLGRAGVQTFLVGESLMRQPDVAAATRALLGTRTAEASEAAQ